MESVSTYRDIKRCATVYDHCHSLVSSKATGGKDRSERRSRHTQNLVCTLNAEPHTELRTVALSNFDSLRQP